MPIMTRHPARHGHGGIAVAVLIIGLVLLVLAWAGIGDTLADAAAAPAQTPSSPTTDGYGGTGGTTQHLLVVDRGPLPFTGLDLAMLAFGAFLLLVTGYFLRRRATRRADS